MCHPNIEAGEVENFNVKEKRKKRKIMKICFKIHKKNINKNI